MSSQPWELPIDLNSLIALTIWIDGRLRERRRERDSVPCRPRSIPTLPRKNPGDPRSLHVRVKPMSPEFSRESQRTANSPPS
jgi:hypothetical protein